MNKVIKSFTLDSSVFDDLEHFAELDDRKNSPFLNKLLKEAFAEMKQELGFQQDSSMQEIIEGGG